MGQKIHPLGLRIGITQKHHSNWFAKQKDYARLLLEDKKLRSYILNKYATLNISQFYIARAQTTQNLETLKIVDFVEISIHTPTPFQIVGRSNSKQKIMELTKELENLCQQNRKKLNLPKIRIMLRIFKVKNVYAEASVLADFLIQQLEQRISFRSALKKTLNRTRRAQLKGIKIQISGRLNGAEIARTEWVRKGRVPLQTLRADIDYSYKVAKTIYGILGIKVWTFKGEKK